MTKNTCYKKSTLRVIRKKICERDKEGERERDKEREKERK